MRGSSHQGAAELEQLALTAGERAGVVIGKAAEADQLEQLRAPARAPRARARDQAPRR